MVNWGIIGAGGIARVFCNGLRFSKTGKALAVASRDGDRAAAFAEKFRLPRSFEGYPALLADDEIDAVYISVIHPHHAQWAIRAAEVGKAILVEKPIALNHAEACAMIDAARANGVFLMEAFMYRCHPQIARARELIREGAIGEVHTVRASFGYKAHFDTSSRAFSNELAGGGILDVGCYPASIVRCLAGAPEDKPFLEPRLVKASGELGPTGVDHWAEATLEFENGISAEIATGVERQYENDVRVVGTAGTLVIPNPWLPSTPCRGAPGPLPPDTEFPPSELLLERDGETETVVVEADRDLFSYEADMVGEHIDAKQAPAMTWDDSLGNMLLLDRWRSEIGLIYDSEKQVRATTIAGRELRRAADTPMVYGRIPGLDKDVSRLVQGCDRNWTVPYTEVLLDRFFELGGNCFDTSHAYGGGSCETYLGAWIRARGTRDEVVVLEKGGNSPKNTPQGLAEELEAGLENMQLDHADIYLMHRDKPDIPAGEIVDVMNRLKSEGKTTVFGVSNWTLPRLMEAREYADRNGLEYFSVVSNQFSLARMQDAWWAGGGGADDYWASCSEPEFRKWFEETQMALVPWSSQASGFFLDEDQRDPMFDFDRCWRTDENIERRERARKLAAKYGVREVTIALAWALAQDFPVFPIVGARRPCEIEDSLKAFDARLSEDERKWLDLERDEMPG